MKRDFKYRKVLRAINHYLLFFLFVAFIISCCMMLFVTVLSRTLDITLTKENLNAAAKLTFVNVIFLSAIITAVDGIRRKITVDRPVRRITEATEKMMQGDFKIEIPIKRRHESGDKFTEIAECINKMAKELSGIETLRTDFIANVSHEIKTPLSVIHNYSKMLQQQEISEEERQEYARAISEASRKLSILITNILKLNKLENQQIYPKAERYNLSEQLCECLLAFERIWEEKKIEIETDIDEDVFITADEEMMTLVFNNLLSNAMKFTQPGGTVGLSLKTDAEYAVVSVSDSGCGISKEVGAHIFEKFYQGDTSHATEGNGLGLTLVKRVIDITESEIEVTSRIAQGSVFTVKIKREQNEAH